MKNEIEENLQENNNLDNIETLNAMTRDIKITKSVRNKSKAPIGATSLNDQSRANRPERIPVGSQSHLKVSERKGFVRRWVNDRPGRLEMFKKAGYEFVSDENLPVGEGNSKDPSILGAIRCQVVDKHRGDKAYLMEIPEEFYREDQAAKRKKRQESLSKAMNPILENRYGSIEIEKS